MDKESYKILELSIKAISVAFDEFVSECMDDGGKPKTPKHRALMKARGYLPPYCDKALSKKHNNRLNLTPSNEAQKSDDSGA